MERVFLDANILVSAALTRGSRLHELWQLPQVRLVGSPHVVEEARRNVTELAAVGRLDELISAMAVLPSEPAEFPFAGGPDLPPKDRPVLAAAIASGCDYLLTGDLTHFGELMGKAFAGVTVMLPGEYLRSKS